jgi:hypothetical protein
VDRGTCTVELSVSGFVIGRRDGCVYDPKICNKELTGVLRTVREGMTMIQHYSAVMREIVAEARERDRATLETDRAQVFPRGGYGLHLLKG